MPKPGWKSVSLPEEMVGEIDGVIEQRPGLGYKGVGSFVISTVRRMIGETRPALEHFNVYEDHVTVIDHRRRTLADIYFRDGNVYCELCEEKECEHVQYALSIPKIEQALREKGWAIEEGEVIRGVRI